jgi:hypothetical protein
VLDNSEIDAYNLISSAPTHSPSRVRNVDENEDTTLPYIYPATAISPSPSSDVVLSPAQTDIIPLVWPVRERCNPSAPCGRCEGNCRRDADCRGALICFYKNNGFLVVDSVPGCSGHDLSSIDRCTVGTRDLNDMISSLRPVKLYCSEEEPCGRCKGKCFNDVHCQGDLVCFLNEGGLPRIGAVPGCIGDDVVKSHWCTAPAAIAELSSPQQEQPTPASSKGPQPNSPYALPSSSPSTLAQPRSPYVTTKSAPQRGSHPNAPSSKGHIHTNSNVGADTSPEEEAPKNKDRESLRTSKKSKVGKSMKSTSKRKRMS